MPTVSDNLPNAPAEKRAEEVGGEQQVDGPAPDLQQQEVETATGGTYTDNVAFIWADALYEGYEDEPYLPPHRLAAGFRLLDATGVRRWREIEAMRPDPAFMDLDTLRDYHHDSYIRAMWAVGEERASRWSPGGLEMSYNGTAVVSSAAEWAICSAAAARTATRVVLSGQATRAVSLAGCQVHARPTSTMGEDIFNDVVLSLLDARAAGSKVAFLNLDAEHATVVEETFLGDPQVLALSLHEAPEFLYPTTGSSDAIGTGAGRGRNVNVPLPPGAGDSEYLLAFEQIIEPVLTQFAPDTVVLLAGASAHYMEPLAHLRLTSHGYQALVDAVARIAPRLVLLGGGGTRIDVVARLWTLAVATLVGRVESLPRSVPATYARLWGGGSIHDSKPPRLTAEMQAYVAQRTGEALHRTHQALASFWKLPTLTVSGHDAHMHMEPERSSRYEVTAEDNRSLREYSIPKDTLRTARQGSGSTANREPEKTRGSEKTSQGRRSKRHLQQGEGGEPRGEARQQTRSERARKHAHPDRGKGRRTQGDDAAGDSGTTSGKRRRRRGRKQGGGQK